MIMAWAPRLWPTIENGLLRLDMGEDVRQRHAGAENHVLHRPAHHPSNPAPGLFDQFCRRLTGAVVSTSRVTEPVLHLIHGLVNAHVNRGRRIVIEVDHIGENPSRSR